MTSIYLTPTNRRQVTLAAALDTEWSVDEAMNCPACGFECTHINRVAMVDAAGHCLTIAGSGEDDHATMTVETAEPEGVVKQGRRQTAVLVVTCESCDYESLIHFRQHKGSTYIDIPVRYVPPDPEELE